jgi:hypothetical protein
MSIRKDVMETAQTLRGRDFREGRVAGMGGSCLRAILALFV